MPDGGAAAPLHPTIAAMLQRARAAKMPALSAAAPADARALLSAIRPALGTGPAVREMRAVEIPTRTGRVPGLLILPPGRPAALCVYLHGGGWMLGAPADYEALGRTLALRSGCAMLLPDYRLAPEHPFPCGLQDCQDAVAWGWATREELVGWTAPLLLAGDSSGANFAAVVARCASDLPGGVAIAGQVLVYPVTDADFDRESYRLYGAGLTLTTQDMRWFFGHYAPKDRWTDPAITPLHAPDLGRSPPTVVALAELDILHDEGAAYAQRLADAGRLVALRRYAGLTHGFLRLHNLVDTADRAVAELAADLRGFAAGP